MKVYLTEKHYGEVRVVEFQVLKETKLQFRVDPRQRKEILGGSLWNSVISKQDKGLTYTLKDALEKALNLNVHLQQGLRERSLLRYTMTELR